MMRLLPNYLVPRNFGPVASLCLIYDLRPACGVHPLLYFEFRISKKEFRTAEVFESSKAMFFTSIFCGSAVYILKNLIADSCPLRAAGCPLFHPRMVAHGEDICQETICPVGAAFPARHASPERRAGSREEPSIETFSLLPVNQWERFEYDFV
jgi:hypothetical protein